MQLPRMVPWAMLVACLLSPFPALAKRPPLVVPAQDSEVIERLPKGYAALMPSGGATSTREARLARAQRLLETAARTGDTRLASHAEALLATFPGDDENPSLLRARAYAAQHRHEFGSAVALLDRAVALNPRDADARLSRAQIMLVQGRLAEVRSECASLALGVDVSRGLLCVAALALRTGDSDGAARMLDRWQGGAAADDGAIRYALTMRAEAASRAGHADAGARFERALAVDDQDVRTLAAYARHLRGKGQHNKILQLLDGTAGSDALQLERALAARANRDARASKMIADHRAGYALARAAGAEPELRDEALFALEIDGDAKYALKLAVENFATQRDAEDVDILLRAAAAAERPQALRPLQEWASTQKLELPASQGSGR